MIEKINCECTIIHKDVLDRVAKTMPDKESQTEMAQIFSLFGDPTRLGILTALYHADMCVCDLSSLLGMSQSSISHSLRILKHGRLVKNRKEGRIVYYSLFDTHIRTIIDEMTKFNLIR